MKLVLFGDLHLDTPFKWADHTVARARRQALRDTLDAIVDLAADVGADALCCAGDLYEHDMVAPDTASFVRAAFARLHPMPVLVAPGNHDWYGPTSLYARTEWSPNVHVFTADRLSPVPLAQGFTIWGGAHRRPAGTANFLDGFGVEGGGLHVALFHGSARSGLAIQEEGKEPHAPFDAHQIPDAGLHHALVGHFHTPADGEWHTYAGNPEPLTFGETGPRGAVVVEFGADGSVSRTRHQVSRTTLHDLVVDLTAAESSQEIRDRVAGHLTDRRGSVRVTLTGELAPTCSVDPGSLHDLGPHLDALVIRTRGLGVGYDIEALAAQASTVRGQFVRDVLAAPDLDDDLRRRVLVTGLRALDGRTDLEVA